MEAWSAFLFAEDTVGVCTTPTLSLFGGKKSVDAAAAGCYAAAYVRVS
jgi:hypothetical protein